MISFEHLPSLQNISKEDCVKVADMWLCIDVEYWCRYIIGPESVGDCVRAARVRIFVSRRTACESSSSMVYPATACDSAGET